MIDLQNAAQEAGTCTSTGPNTGNGRYSYNGAGLRVRSKTYPAGGTTTDDFVWDAGAGLPNILQDVRTQAAVTTTTTFVYGLGLISTTDNAGLTSYYLSDGLDSTSQLTDSSGNQTDNYAYDVFGAPKTVTGTTANDFRFTGQQDDRNANRGLYYLRARAYDPALGRFLSRDTMPFPNRYSYGENNPVDYADPSGHCRVETVLRGGGSSSSSGISLFGRSLWYHAYIVTADPLSGEKTIFEGGPTGTSRFNPLKLGTSLHASQGGNLAIARALGNDSAVSYAGNRKKTVYDDCSPCTDINAALNSVADAINAADLSYKFWSQNSNSVASELLESIGIKLGKPGGMTPGWGNNLID